MFLDAWIEEGRRLMGKYDFGGRPVSLPVMWLGMPIAGTDRVVTSVLELEEALCHIRETIAATAATA